MKIFFYLVQMTLLAFLFMGCDKTDEPPYVKAYQLSFVDKEGNDLLKDIEFTPGAIGSLPFLKKGTYSCEFVKPEKSKTTFFNIVPVELEKVNGYNALKIGVTMNDKYENSLTHRFICPFIFGDDKEHILVSYWKSEDNPYDAILVRLTVDGKDGKIVENSYKYKRHVIAILNK